MLGGMGQALPLPRMTYPAYLALEAGASGKHEYLRGEVWAMAGGSREHGRLTAALTVALGTALRGRPCAIYSSDVRVRVRGTDRTTYPDLTVVCGPAEAPPEDPESVANPTLLVEVLSETTEASDRGEKFAHYRHLASLREYVLVAQKERRIEIFRREGQNEDQPRWTFEEAVGGGTIKLLSLGIELAVNDVYDDPTAGS
jgi:Uma2 family endonuclease